MWNKVSEKELPYGEEVIAFSEKWIDEDRNPSGIRVGFLRDDGFISESGTTNMICMRHIMKKETTMMMSQLVCQTSGI